jgi:hypothetical protein
VSALQPGARDGSCWQEGWLWRCWCPRLRRRPVAAQMRSGSLTPTRPPRSRRRPRARRRTASRPVLVLGARSADRASAHSAPLGVDGPRPRVKLPRPQPTGPCLSTAQPGSPRAERQQEKMSGVRKILLIQFSVISRILAGPPRIRDSERCGACSTRKTHPIPSAARSRPTASSRLLLVAFLTPRAGLCA